METIRSVLLTALLTMMSGAAMSSDVDFKAVWVRGTVSGQKATGAFMEVTSKSGATLVGASSPVAGVTKIHEMKMADGVM
jgi:copper(I)-binding protein